MIRPNGMMWAFLAGATAGAVTALLFAPEKGEVTRRRIKDGAVRIYDGGKERVHALGEALHEGKQAYLREASKAS